MMDEQLGAWLLFDQIAHHARATEVVTLVGASGRIHRATYGEVAARAQQLMHALDTLGVPEGAPVATLAWNSQWHLECYFGIPCAGRIIHTVNVRLSADEIAYILADAGDRVVFADADLLTVLGQATKGFSTVDTVVVFGDVPEGSPGNLISYDELLAAESDSYPWRRIDEYTTLGLCYTSGTTGSPKGVAYTHRSTFLHALAATSATACRVGPGDTVLPMVPMFHASAWGLPYAAAGAGAKQVFLAGAAQPAAIVDLLVQERVTIAAGVPTIWFSVAEELDSRTATLPDLRHIVVGGSQPPRALMQRYLDNYNVPILQAWGMTETSPLASVAWPAGYMADWTPEQVMDAARSQAGRPLPGVRISIRDDAGIEVPRDATTVGTLLVRGPWVADRYTTEVDGARWTEDGWFDTGDMAAWNSDGSFVIADRAKDLIKSGGEWISSLDMENAIAAMPTVREVAVIAVPHEKWQERPLACIALEADGSVELAEVCQRLESAGFAKWQLPDRIEIVESIPRTSVGKYDKKVLRAQFGTPA
jgi:fatty-acyl-CoA synthase